MASMRDGGSILKHRAPLCLAGARIQEIERQTGVTELILKSKDSYGPMGRMGKVGKETVAVPAWKIIGLKFLDDLP